MGRGVGRRWVLGSVVLSLAWWSATRAVPAWAAEPQARLRVAVLEHRAGASRIPNLGERIAQRLTDAANLAVVSPQEARRMLSSVDSELARCGGRSPCLAALGERIGVDEILLIGVAQLGELVLSLERIMVATATVQAQLAETLGSDTTLPLADATLDGWLRRLYPAGVFRRYGQLMVRTSLAEVEVLLDGQPQGMTPLLAPIRLLAPQRYRMELVRAGYLPLSMRLDVMPDTTIEVHSELAARPRRRAGIKYWLPWLVLGTVITAAGVAGAAR